MGILEQWSAKAEYDYYDFGTRTITLSERLLVLPSTSRVNVWQRNLSRQVRDQLSILSPQRLALAGRASRAAASLNTEPLPGSLVTVTSRPIIAGELAGSILERGRDPLKV
jgi:hypothetical protein